MGNKKFEGLLGYHCAPTFSGLKAASMLTVKKSAFDDVYSLLKKYRPCLSCKGIASVCLKEDKDYVLMLFYREAELANILSRREVKSILKRFGYPVGGTVIQLLSYLIIRINTCQKGFPHEVGLFLGYPPKDVLGFIEHKGHDYAYCGYWKVYSNEQETKKLFQVYTECTKAFCRRLEAGEEIEKLLMAV